MYRQYTPRLQIVNRLGQFLWHQMDVAPIGVILPIFHYRKVDRRKPMSDLCEMRIVTAVTRQIDPP